jgi:multicomponent Na+:H+ antiporter subunit E
VNGGLCRAWAWRITALALVWWALSAGDPVAWAWGLPAIVVAAVLMPPPGRWHLRPLVLLAFLPHVLWLSLVSGLQVARLACCPRLQLDTRLIDHPWHCLPEGPARLFMASLLNLIPGTLTLRLTPEGLHVHVLHFHPDTPAALARLERRIARLYGVASPGREVRS